MKVIITNKYIIKYFSCCILLLKLPKFQEDELTEFSDCVDEMIAFFVCLFVYLVNYLNPH